MRAASIESTGRRTGRICVALAVLGLDLATGAAQSPLPEGPGREQLTKVCTGCHAPEIVAAHRYTEAEWEQRMLKMLELGAKGTDDELYQILDYLVKNFPFTGGKIEVNKAAAREIERGLEVTPKEAEAIVRYRDNNGPFRSIEELKKVPDVDAKKINARKDYLVF